MSEHTLNFRERGYQVVEAFTETEAAQYMEQITDLSKGALEENDSGKWGLKHGVSLTPELWTLASHPVIREAVSEVLDTSDIIYGENSDIKVWQQVPPSGWHRDSIAKRIGDSGEWESDYSVVRVACYFQPAVHNFLWGGIPGSHLREEPLSQEEISRWRDRVPPSPISIGSRLDHLESDEGNLWIRSRDVDAEAGPETPVWIPTEPTQCVIFDPRIIHAGGPVDTSRLLLSLP